MADTWEIIEAGLRFNKYKWLTKLHISVSEQGKLNVDLNESQYSNSRFQLRKYAFLVEGERAAHNNWCVTEVRCKSFVKALLLAAHPTKELWLEPPEI